MKKDQKHIRQKLKDTYPEPDVPVDSAWTGMKDMLDHQMPVNHSFIDKLKSVKTILFAAPAAVVSVGLAVWILTHRTQAITSVPGNSSTLISKIDSYRAEHWQAPEKIGWKDSIAAFGKSFSDSGGAVSEKVKDHAGPDSASLATRGSISQNNQSGYAAESPIDNGKNGIVSKENFENKPAIISTSPKRATRNKPRLESKETNQNSVTRQTEQPTFSVLRDSSGMNQNSKSVRENLPANDSSEPSGTARKTESNAYTGQQTSVINSERKITQTGHATERIPLFLSIKLLNSKSPVHENFLKQKFAFIQIQPSNVGFYETGRRDNKKPVAIFQNIHFGLQWHAGLPAKGYDIYFKGANEKNQFYTLLIPGAWIKKQLSDKNEILLRFNPYTQYFGGNKKIASSITKVTDSTSYTTSLGLIKISGFNVGLQFNQQLYKNWHAGLGANLQCQQRGLISRNISTSDTSKIVDYDALFSIKQTSNEGKYLNLYFLTTNLEVFYAWKQFQLGVGAIVPVTSMTTSKAENKLKPVSGQLFFRWQLK